MLSLRWLLPLAVVAVAASVSLLALEKEVPLELGPWLPGLEEQLEEIDRIALYQGSTTPEVVIVRTDTQWRVETLDAYPADMATLRSLVKQLLEAERLEPRTDNPDRFSVLGLDSPTKADSEAVLLELQASGEVLYALVLGERNARGRLVRQLDQRQSWLVSEALEVGLASTDWVDSLILNLPSDALLRIEYTSPEQGYSLQREEGQWRLSAVPDGREPRAEPFLAQSAEALMGLRFDTVGQDVEAAEPASLARVDYHYSDGATLSALRLSDQDGQWVRLAVAVPESGESSIDWAGISKRLDGWRFQFPLHRMATLFRPLEEQLIPLPDDASGEAE